MRILIGVYHLHQDLLYVFVGCFHRTIHLRAVGNQIPVSNLELLAKLLDYFPIQILFVIYNVLSWHAVVANDVLFQELGHHSLSDAFIGGGLHPFGEVINGHQDILIPIQGFQNHKSDDIHSPS